MAEPFDPYHKWLGIPPKHQPPHHYRLLGLDLFEADADVIEHAADQRMRHIRSLATGKHSGLSQRILNEIAAARLCLLSPQKATYDARLREQLGATATPAAPKLPPSQVQPAKPALKPVLLAQPTQESRDVERSRWSLPWKAIIAALSLSVIVVAGIRQLSRPAPIPADRPSPSAAGAAEPDKLASAAPANKAEASPTHLPDAQAALNSKPPRADPAPTPQRQIESSLGLVTENFAICQTMPLETFLEVANAMRASGYRPLRARPYVAEAEVLVAAVWTADRLPWTMSAGLKPEQLAAENQLQAEAGLVPVDVAAWQLPGEAPRAIAVWARTGAKPADFEIYAAVPHAEQTARYEGCIQRGLRPLQRQNFLGVDGQSYHSFLFNRHQRAYYLARGSRSSYDKSMQPDRFQIDTGLSQRLHSGQLEAEYSGIWEVTTKRQSIESHGLPPAEHLKQCRTFVAEGRRPVAIGVSFTAPDQAWVTSSVWH